MRPILRTRVRGRKPGALTPAAGSMSATLIFDRSRPGLDGLLDSLTTRVYNSQPLRFFRNQSAPRSIRIVDYTGPSAPIFTTVNPTGGIVELTVGLADQAPTSGTWNVGWGLLTSGTVTTAKRYRIKTFVTGDDFTNIGAASNATGVVFTASGATPTTWTNGSTLIELTLTDCTFEEAAATVETKLNAMASITAAGGVTVIKSNRLYTIKFDDDGNRAEFEYDVEGLVPPCVATTTTAQAGDSDTPEIQTVEIAQQPFATMTLSGGDMTSTLATGDLVFNGLVLRAAFAATTSETIQARVECKFTESGASAADVVFRGSAILHRDLLQSAGALPASVFPLPNTPVFLSAVTGYTGGGGTNLDGIVTTGLTAGLLACFVHATEGLRFYRLVAGTDAEASPTIIRPDDYHASTNAKVWKSAL